MIKKSGAKDWMVLVVDDESDSLEIVERILRFYGAKVQAVRDCASALKIIEGMIPTLVIMDLSMPDIDGWEMLYRLKNNPRLKNVQVVALTAHAMKGDRERALAAGFQHYLTKPLSPSSFFDDLLSGLIEGSRDNGHDS